MIHLILAGTGFVLWALYIIMTYYSKSYSSIDHIENTSGYGAYIITVLVIYGIYKIWQIFWSGKREVRFHIWSILGYSMLHLFVLCITYASLPSVLSSPLLGNIKPSGLTLFIHSITLLLYPILLVIIARGVGSSILSYIIKDWEGEPLRLRFPADITVGFFIFTIGLLVLGFTGTYTLSGLLVVLGILLVVSIPGLLTTYRDVKNTSVTFPNHSGGKGLLEAINPRLLSAEFGFMVISFLIGVSLINAIRPMPIGWDDLGVYMNFPKIMAMSGEYLKGAGMYTWQLITGTGFLFSYTAVQAFYINQLGGILAVIIIISGLSLILENPKKKYLISLPILLAAVFYAMPMNIFQQAKDMKLDPALLAVSISGLLTLMAGWKETNTRKKNLLILGLAGTIIGFAFSIKLTSLMLIMAGFGLIAYRLLSLWGFVGFFFLFLGIFTKAGFWSQMNVWMPTSNPALINTISIFLFFIGLVSLIVAWKQTSMKHLHDWFIFSLVFLVGVTIGLSPWIVRNVSEVQPWKAYAGQDTKSLVLNSILGGSGGVTSYDFSTIYSKEEYEEKMKIVNNQGISSSGQALNEDMGRYFGYEKGINNYLKIPPNLTFQKNQAGEFTDITYIFLALVPGLLLFVRGRKNIFPTGMFFILVFFFVYYFTPFGQTTITNFFSLENGAFGNLLTSGGNILLIGYGILVALNILFIIFFHYFTTHTSQEDKHLREVIVTLGVYGFLFLISAFGIVWYGILVYFLFFLVIGLTASRFISYSEDESTDTDIFGIKVTLATILFIFISVYFVRSAFPHGWNNFKDASYNEFKFNILTQEESIFAYRQDYITPIATLNVKDPSLLIEETKKLAKNEKLKTFLNSEQLKGISARDYATILFSLSQGKDPSIAKDAKIIGDALYKGVLYPTKDHTNTGGIYRIGTFMTYLINQNRMRYFEDSLIFSFETFFYNQKPEITIDRMRKLGLKYLLIDLNAATIDKDPRHALTTRFEHLLHTMKAKNLTLVDTDNICLHLALDEYKNGKLQNPEEFVDIAGTNYESYRTDDTGKTSMIYRGQKQQNCYNYILKRLYVEKVDIEYPYLNQLKTIIDESGAMGTNGQVDQQKLMTIFSQYIGQSWFALFEINETPVEIKPDTSADISSGSILTGSGQ